MSEQVVTLGALRLSLAAAGVVEWTGTDVAADIRALQAGEIDASSLLAECLDGAEAGQEDAWREYVSAVVLVSARYPRST